MVSPILDSLSCKFSTESNPSYCRGTEEWEVAKKSIKKVLNNPALPRRKHACIQTDGHRQTYMD